METMLRAGAGGGRRGVLTTGVMRTQEDRGPGKGALQQQQQQQQQQQAPTNHPLPPPKPPKTIRKYLSILLRSSTGKQIEAATVKGTRRRADKERLTNPRLYNVPTSDVSTIVHPASLPGMATPKHHTIHPRRFSVPDSAPPTTSNKQVHFLFKPPELRRRQSGHFEGVNRAGSRLLSGDALSASDGASRKGLKERSRSASSPPPVPQTSTPHSSDVRRLDRPTVDTYSYTSYRRVGRSSPEKARSWTLGSGSPETAATSSCAQTPEANQHHLEEVAPPSASQVKLAQMPVGLSPEEAKQYIRILIRARLQNVNAATPKSATTTPTAPYSSTDLIGSYNNDTNQYPPPVPDDLHITNNHGSHGNIDTDRSDRRRARDGDRRPLSRKESKRHIPPPSRESKGALPFDSPTDRPRDQELGSGGIAAVTSSSSLTQKTNNYFKPLASRNSFLRNSVTSPTPRSAPNGQAPPTETVSRTQQFTDRESEDILVAMGTNWNPSNAFQRNGRPGSYSNGTSSSSNNGGYLSHQQLSISQAPTTLGPRHLGKRSTVPHLSGGRLGSRDSEPRYPDPFSGAPATLHQRISEINALESETVRWERTRKFQKKKPRSDT